MSKYLKADIDHLKQIASIADFVEGDLKRKYSKVYADCPVCGGKEKLQITDNSKYRNIYCHKCGFKQSGVFDVVMYYRNLEYREAVEFVADRYGIKLRTEEEQRRENIKRKEDSMEDSFCMRQLKGSGLTLEDVTARVRTEDGKDWVYLPTFTKGSLDGAGHIYEDHDEMLIHYYDLFGNPMKVSVRSSGRLKPYIRVRWSLPEAHKDKDGKAAKYGCIAGAEARFYFPNKIREMFRNKQQFDTLIIQEGEKKAEKACKHGIPSIAIQGIYNIGNKDSGLINDLHYLVRDCGIRKVVLLFDSDYDHLSRNLKADDAIDQRPNQFARAAMKFRDYVDTLQNSGLSVDIYFGHINENEADDKGIDDLLCNTLKGREDILAEDINKAMISVQGIGEYVSIHKISVKSDFDILKFWDLRDREAFFKKYASRIKGLGKVKFGKVRYVEQEDGSWIRSSVSGTDEEFWDVSIKEKEKTGEKEKKVKFKLLPALAFLKANGFSRVMSEELGENSFGYVSIEKGIATMIPEFKIRDFIYNYVCINCKDEDVIEFFANSLFSVLDKGRLERMSMAMIPEFFEPDYQNRYYHNGQIRITAEDVEFGPMSQIVWKQNVLGRSFERVRIFDRIDRTPDGQFRVVTTPDGDECEFLQYLINTSKMDRDKEQHDMSEEEIDQLYLHLVNKLTSIGYLLTDYRNPSEERVVVAMDARMSEVGKSNGRSGKSLIGKALEKMSEQAFIDGKEINASEQFLFNDVTTRSRHIFFDDVKPHFDFIRLFAAISGPLTVNPKGGARFKIPYEKVPKMYITTNHAIDADDDSSRDRISLMLFSDYYNATYKPVDDFGHTFFNGWDDRQWQLFDNLMAECVMYYFRSRRDGWSRSDCGMVAPPLDQAEQRQLRQKMGEVFLTWAEVYFDILLSDKKF